LDAKGPDEDAPPSCFGKQDTDMRPAQNLAAMQAEVRSLKFYPEFLGKVKKAFAIGTMTKKD
jgi:hypothetical protein